MHDEAIVSAVASKVTYGGFFATMFGWLLSAEFLGLVGAFCAVVGVLTNVIVSYRRDKRESKEHRAKLRGFPSTFISTDI